MNRDELSEVLRLHEMWRRGDFGGRRADLIGADLIGADLSKADLSKADLIGADLSKADLTWANLIGADLSKADLSEADLIGTNLTGTNLSGADLSKAALPHFQIPAGSLTVSGKKNGKLVQMRVPPAARRTASLVGRKCRAEWVVTEWIEGGGPVVVSNEYGITEYRVGEITRPHAYCDDIRIECAPGIHFFLTREEAEEWR